MKRMKEEIKDLMHIKPSRSQYLHQGDPEEDTKRHSHFHRISRSPLQSHMVSSSSSSNTPVTSKTPPTSELQQVQEEQPQSALSSTQQDTAVTQQDTAVQDAVNTSDGSPYARYDVREGCMLTKDIVQNVDHPPAVEFEHQIAEYEAPIVTEDHQHVHRHVVKPIIEHEIHETIHEYIRQPVHAREKLAVEYLDVTHTPKHIEHTEVMNTAHKEMLTGIRQQIADLAAVETRVEEDHEYIHKTPIIKQVLHKHYRRHIQPIIYKHIVAPHVINEVQVIHETHHLAPVVVDLQDAIPISYEEYQRQTQSEGASRPQDEKSLPPHTLA